MGEYKVCNQDTENIENEERKSSNNQKNQLINSIEGIEIYLAKYKDFDWINCSDIDLQDARYNVAKLLDLAQKIEKEFKRI